MEWITQLAGFPNTFPVDSTIYRLIHRAWKIRYYRHFQLVDIKNSFLTIQIFLNVLNPRDYLRRILNRTYPLQSLVGLRQPGFLGSLSNDDGDANENGKKTIGLDWQNNNSARVSRFFVHFFAVSARVRRENAKFHVLSRT